MVETRFLNWPLTLPADGWRGAVAELAELIPASPRKLAEFLETVRPVFKGFRIEREMYECRRVVRITRILERPFNPWPVAGKARRAAS